MKIMVRPRKFHSLTVNVIVTQHHRRPSMQISRKPVVLGYIAAGFGSFWLVLLVLSVVLAGFGWFRVLVTTLVLLVVLGGFGPFWVVLAGSVF